MRGSVAAALVAAALLFVVVTASDEQSGADTSESHMSAAERALLGYINVRGPRKNWINHNHRVHLLKQQKKRAAASPQVMYRYEKFPLQEFLVPMEAMARRLEQDRSKGLKRFQRLRRVLLGEKPAPASSSANNKTSKSNGKKAPALSPADKAALERERALEKQLADLKKKISLREAEAKAIIGTQKCDNGTAYFCRRGRCACMKKEAISCGSKMRWELVCSETGKVGTSCRCSRLTAAGRARVAAAAAKAARQYAQTCSVRSSKCRHARELQRHSYYSMWASRRQYLSRAYDRMYNRYTELLARYFKKKYDIMIREYVRAKKQGKDLRQDMRELVERHKAAMLHHAKLHQLAFMRYSQLEESYRGLDARYNKLVDKYRLDLSAALDAVREKKKRLAEAKARVNVAHEKTAELRGKLQLVKSEIAKADASFDGSEQRRKTLKTEHDLLVKQIKNHEKDVADAKNHKDRVVQDLKNQIASLEAKIAQIKTKIATTTQEAQVAADNAKSAYTQLQKSLETLQKQTDEAEQHTKAAEAALKAKNHELKAAVATAEAAADASRAKVRKATASTRNKLDTTVHDAAKKLTKRQDKLRGLNKHLHKVRKALAGAKKFAARIARRLKAALQAAASANDAQNHRLSARNALLAQKLKNKLATLRSRIAKLHKLLNQVRVRRDKAVAALKKFQAESARAARDEQALRQKYDRMQRRFSRISMETKAEKERVKKLRHKLHRLRKTQHHHRRHGGRGAHRHRRGAHRHRRGAHRHRRGARRHRRGGRRRRNIFRRL